jgi:hypothetical protein
MKALIPQFEHKAQRVISPHQFLVRLPHSGIIAIGIIAVSLFIGMLGYLTGTGKWPRNFSSVKVFRMDLEADFKRLFVIGFVC